MPRAADAVRAAEVAGRGEVRERARDLQRRSDGLAVTDRDATDGAGARAPPSEEMEKIVVATIHMVGIGGRMEVLMEQVVVVDSFLMG